MSNNENARKSYDVKSFQNEKSFLRGIYIHDWSMFSRILKNSPFQKSEDLHITNLNSDLFVPEKISLAEDTFEAVGHFFEEKLLKPGYYGFIYENEILKEILEPTTLNYALQKHISETFELLDNLQ